MIEEEIFSDKNNFIEKLDKKIDREFLLKKINFVLETKLTKKQSYVLKQLMNGKSVAKISQEKNVSKSNIWEIRRRGLLNLKKYLNYE